MCIFIERYMDIFMPAMPISSVGRKSASGRGAEHQGPPAALLGSREEETGAGREVQGALSLEISFALFRQIPAA